MTPSEIYLRLSQVDHIYTADEVDDYLQEIGDLPIVQEHKKNGKRYYNTAAALDSETTSFEHEGERVATTYVWFYDINGLILGLRTWDEFTKVYIKIVDHFKTVEDDVRLPIYVHNLPFDFSFFHKWLTFKEIFALDRGEPIRALTTENVEFRCSLKLAGLSLAKVGENLTKYKVKKRVGDLDYSQIRHSGTPLTDTEIGYCVADVRVVVAYILEEIEQNGDITRVPMTRTGYVRRYCRKKCFGDDIKDEKERNKQFRKYTDLMKSLTMTPDEYAQLRRAFAGGFTHASNWTVTKKQCTVASFDECSAYPAQMLARKFPMSAAEEIQNISKEEFTKSLRCYCCLFDVRFTGVMQKRANEHVLSISKCTIPRLNSDTKEPNKYFVDNGKIVFADEVFTTLTETDLRVLRQFYTWKTMQVSNFRRYRKDYMPTAFVKAILDLYVDKCELKGVEGKEAELQMVKGMLNSAYGMAVTNIIRDVISYDAESGSWNLNSKPDVDKEIEKYNKSRNRFLSYAWGVWVTSYAREAILLYGVKSCGTDYCYSDTDSVKFLNMDDHKEAINAYNELVKDRLAKAMKYHGIDVERTRPKGKQIGIFEFEGVYKYFKSNGAKRYLVQHEDDELVLTVSGLNKQDALIYMLEATRTPYHIVERKGVKHIIADGDTSALFDFFDVDLEIPEGSTGKNLHTYFEHEISGELVDYMGNKGFFHELSGTNLSPVAYTSNVNNMWLEYIFGKAGIIYAK